MAHNLRDDFRVINKVGWFVSLLFLSHAMSVCLLLSWLNSDGSGVESTTNFFLRNKKNLLRFCMFRIEIK